MYYFYPLQKVIKRSRKGTNHMIVNWSYNTLSSTRSFLFGGNSTAFQKLSAISCKYYYYCWIHITDFLCYLLSSFYALIFTAQKYRTTISSYYCAIVVWALNRRFIQGSIWLLLVRLVYSWKSTGTLVTKFSLVRYPSFLWMITSPQAVELT